MRKTRMLNLRVDARFSGCQYTRLFAWLSILWASIFMCVRAIARVRVRIYVCVCVCVCIFVCMCVHCACDCKCLHAGMRACMREKSVQGKASISLPSPAPLRTPVNRQPSHRYQLPVRHYLYRDVRVRGRLGSKEEWTSAFQPETGAVIADSLWRNAFHSEARTLLW